MGWAPSSRSSNSSRVSSSSGGGSGGGHRYPSDGFGAGAWCWSTIRSERRYRARSARCRCIRARTVSVQPNCSASRCRLVHDQHLLTRLSVLTTQFRDAHSALRESEGPRVPTQPDTAGPRNAQSKVTDRGASAPAGKPTAMTGGSGAPAPLQPAQRPVGRAGCGRVAGGSPKYLAGALSVLTLFGVVVGPRGWHSCCSGRPLSRPAA